MTKSFDKTIVKPPVYFFDVQQPNVNKLLTGLSDGRVPTEAYAVGAHARLNSLTCRSLVTLM